MKKKYVCAIFFCILFASTALSPRAQASVTVQSADAPWWIIVPSINLSSPIKGVGIDKKGNMDVPSGKTKDVGWYKYGVVPGNTGTAVLDAHVTAAFKKLNELEPGSDIYIYTESGKLLHYVATEAHTYEVKKLSPLTLFAPTKSKSLNLITCAGTLLGNGEASHRLIVSARLKT